MIIEKIREFYESTPFRPFVIHLADGRALTVQSKEFLATAPSGRTVSLYQPDDSLNVIDLLLVTDLEVPPGNGQKKRRSKG
jgi:hypothetical protein